MNKRINPGFYFLAWTGLAFVGVQYGYGILDLLGFESDPGVYGFLVAMPLAFSGLITLGIAIVLFAVSYIRSTGARRRRNPP